MHQKIDEFNCNICDKKFKRRWSLRSHLNFVHGVQENKGSQVDNSKVYESLPLPELKQEGQKSNIIQETAEQLVAEAPEVEAKALAKAEKKAKLEADAAEAEAVALAAAEEKAKL